jgi:cellulose synthase/poly-beta-1,6-N-acetylglucosamine synthase-like glycosyltransferase
MIMLTVALWLISAPVIIMLGMFTAEMLCGQWACKIVSSGGLPPTITVIMPAHNEAGGIAATIVAVTARLPEGTQLLVVADNCTDDTAACARAAGADVIERNDPDRRGKGYALSYGQAHLRSALPDCVVIIDADCVPDAGAVAQIAALACATGRPVQARYVFTTDARTSPMVQISNFAFLIKNFVRQRGMARMGGPALLTGTGMAFPGESFDRAPLATGNIVEDLALGIDFTAGGLTPLFAESAIVRSEAASEADTITQRRRWEHGFIATARAHAFPLIGRAIAQRSWPLFLLGSHLLVPPFALLLLLSVALLMLLGVGALIGGGFAPLMAVGAAGTTGLTLTLIAWVRFGQSTLRPATLLRLPAYLLWKLPVYLGLLRGGETQWVRTKRPGD